MLTEKVLFLESKDSALWDKIRTDDAYQAFRKDLENAFMRVTQKPLPALGFELFTIYTKTGSRSEYEQEYFLRRLALNSSFLCYMIYKDEKYLRFLENIIMLILDEYTWAVPATVGDRTDYEIVGTYIDLFAAETGHALSEILYIMGDILDERITTRIEYEVNRRIISSFLNRTFSFEESCSNWAAVCGGSVGMTFIYMAPEKFPLIKARLKECLKRYIDCLGDDGVCTEGVGYWVYGFGYYTYFEELYKEYAGEYLIPKDEKHKEISKFLQRMHISDDKVICFSDSNEKELIMPGFLSKLNDIYGDDVRMLPMNVYAKPVTGGIGYRFAHTVRNFLWFNPEKVPLKQQDIKETVYFENSQWYIKRTTCYVFAVKGGHNSEPHNHNDVGSFVISNYNNQLIADLGRGEYNKEYFAPETRYNNLCCSSLGHSVPIINGIAQSCGVSYKAGNTKQTADGISMDIGGAYNCADLNSFVRDFSFKDNEVKLIDTISLKKNQAWTSRLVSTVEPVIEGNMVIIENMKIYNNLDITPILITEEIKTHGFMNKQRKVYLIDYTTNESKIELRFVL